MIEFLIIAAYASLALELILVPVPSVASARSLAKTTKGAGLQRWFGFARLYAPVILNLVVFAIPLVQAVLRLVSGAIDRDISWPWSMGIGALLLLGGRALTVVSALAMRRAASLRLLQGSLDVNLKTSGPFARSRNPGLLGMYLFALGILVLQPNAWFALGLIHYLWHMHRKIRIEERFLQGKYGAAYEHYLMQTRRYV